MPLLAALTPEPWVVTHTDEITHPVDTTQTFDLVGLTAATPGAPHAYGLAQEFRARGNTVVMGGPHATLMPQEAAQHVDVVVVGEAETIWPRVLEDVERELVYPPGHHTLDRVTGVTVEVSLLRKQDKQVWTKVLDTLLNVTKDVTLPSPLTLGMNYLNKFSTDVLHQYLPDPNNQKRISLGSFSFIVSNDPSSLNRITKTGLHLRVLPATNAGAGWVDTSHTGNYCFYTKFDGDNWAVYVAPKDSSAADKDDDGCSKSKYTQLMNDYVPLLIEAVPKGIDKSDKRAVEMKSAGVEQCRLYHVKDENCPALKLKQ